MTAESRPKGMGGHASEAWAFVKRVLAAREMNILLAVVVMIIFLSSTSKYFLTVANLRSVVVNFSMDGIMVAGMTILLIGSSLDLSIGSMVSLSGVVAALLMVNDVPVWLAILAGLALGTLVGLINGVLVAKVGVNSIIGTLAMMSIVRGASTIVTRGQPVSYLPKEFSLLGDSTIVGVPTPVIIMLVVVIVADLFLRKSQFLRQIYYIGGNEAAARLSGIKVDQVKIFTFVLMGFLAALSGLITAARYATGASYFGTGAELRIVAAVVIGGVSISGGAGSLLGAMAGLILMALISNMFGLLNIDVYWQTTANGLILLAAILLDTIMVKRRKATVR